FGIDFLIGEEEYLGEGFGTELVRLVGSAAMQDAGAQRLIADPDPGNAPSIKVLENNGYVLDEKTGLYVWDLSQ
ncbi:acetyltransferase, partial [Desulfovibrio sp. OttesenSCG-928-G15]|nr:acetyltransferase [Desulfovibrio sp. OttesenSCG-928-G15]